MEHPLGDELEPLGDDFETWEEERLRARERESESPSAETRTPAETAASLALESPLEIRHWPDGKAWQEDGPVKQRANWQEQRRSGRLSLRMPISLHDQLSAVAAAEGTSLNQFICNVLAATVGWRSVTREARREAQEHSIYERWYNRFS
jgi:hypothetical protein